jgi:hypothetical protein
MIIVKFFHFFHVVACVGKGFEDEISDNSDLSFFRQEIVLARNNPTYENLLWNAGLDD